MEMINMDKENVVVKKKIGEQIFRIHQEMDLSPFDPRDNDNLGTMVCWHKEYNLGDKQPGEAAAEYFEEFIRNNSVYLPLYIYDHSGIAIHFSKEYPFNDHWDAGQIGWIYVTEDKIIKEYGELTDETKRKAKFCLESEVREYNHFVSGEVYRYSIVKLVKCGECGNVEEEIIDSCAGFLGSDFEMNGLYENAGEQWYKVEE